MHTNMRAYIHNINYKLKHSYWCVLKNIMNVIENWKITGTHGYVKQKWENDIYSLNKAKHFIVLLCFICLNVCVSARLCMWLCICISSMHVKDTTLYTHQWKTTWNNKKITIIVISDEIVTVARNGRSQRWRGFGFLSIGCVFVLIDKSIVYLEQYNVFS